MNDDEIEAVVGALQRCVGVPLDQVWQPARDRIVLGLADGTLLLLVPRGPNARIHTVAGRPRNPPKPFSFQGACRARLRGALRTLEKVPGDRVVRVSFGPARLELRLTGKSGGLWLVEGDTVVAAYDGPAPDALPPLPDRPPRHDQPRFDVSGDADLAARRWFEERERNEIATELRGRVERGLRREIDRASRLLEHLGEDLTRAEGAPALRRTADLLAASLHTVPRGAAVAEVTDWESGALVQIALDPARPASATMERLYKQARRLDRVGDRVLERMEEVEGRQKSRRQVLERITTLTLEELREAAALLPKERAGRTAPAKRPYATWTGPDGERVLVGRNAAANRRLTFQVAKGTDWWMHLRGAPGAHVVLPMPSRDQTPSLPLLLAAAQIALATAHVATGEAAEVQYTRVRDVHSVPGGEVGLVTVANEKVLRVIRDPVALTGWTADDQT